MMKYSMCVRKRPMFSYSSLHNAQYPGIITKLPESGELCDKITEFGVAEDHLSPQGKADLPPLQTK